MAFSRNIVKDTLRYCFLMLIRLERGVKVAFYAVNLFDLADNDLYR